MTVISGLLLATGIILVWRSLTRAPALTPMRIGRPSRIRKTLVHAGLDVLQRRIFLTLSLFIPLVTFILVLTMTRTWTVAIAVTCAVFPLPWGWVKRRRIHNRAALANAWPVVVDSLLASVRAGITLPEAVLQLAVSGPEITRPQFALFAREYRAKGRFSEALNAAQYEFLDATADQLFEALRLAREVGGNELGNLLRDLSTVMREDARIRGEIMARQSWTVNAARIAVAAPWIILVLISTRTDAARAYSTGTGMLILATGGFLCIVAYWLMQRIGQLEEFGGRL
ncbi:MAG: type II secretion system F family protein [Actinomycetaceae bacterium]|nr:type II secretion system F family protein [Actinomycetaceae bacterium]